MKIFYVALLFLVSDVDAAIQQKQANVISSGTTPDTTQPSLQVVVSGGSNTIGNVGINAGTNNIGFTNGIEFEVSAAGTPIPKSIATTIAYNSNGTINTYTCTYNAVTYTKTFAYNSAGQLTNIPQWTP